MRRRNRVDPVRPPRGVRFNSVLRGRKEDKVSAVDGCFGRPRRMRTASCCCCHNNNSTVRVAATRGPHGGIPRVTSRRFIYSLYNNVLLPTSYRCVVAFSRDKLLPDILPSLKGRARRTV